MSHLMRGHRQRILKEGGVEFDLQDPEIIFDNIAEYDSALQQAGSAPEVEGNCQTDVEHGSENDHKLLEDEPQSSKRQTDSPSDTTCEKNDDYLDALT